ncbi:linoleoyl-CoA desaturase [bacterium A37T11]|nr:linoleoyl-CoA desaturase [bacterium A37T11]
MSKVSFNTQNTLFSKTLKQRVNAYFKNNNISNTGNRKLYIKSSLLVAMAIANYIVLVFFTPPIVWAVILCVLLGLNMAAIGFNVMHDGGHASFSKKGWLNNLSSYSLNMLGGTIYFWKQKHNISHHTYTNLEGLDHDIEVKFMRMNQQQPRKAFHRFQFAYWFLLYGISYIAWVMYQDFEKYFSGKMGSMAQRKVMPFKEHVVFWITKLTYIFVYLVLPLLMVGWLQALLGWLIAGTVCGFCIALVFQLAHVVEETSFPMAVAGTDKIAEEWMVHQLSTTANFATDNSTISWLLGGLNFQVEHHLFPRISHVHYPAINRLVKQTCKEFNVVYLEHRSVWKAFRSHWRLLYRLGLS